MSTRDKIVIEIVSGVNGLLSIYINDFRVCGSKPWGGGNVVKKWEVPLSYFKPIFSLPTVHLDDDEIEGCVAWDDCGKHIDAGSIHGMVCPEPCEFGRQCNNAKLPRPALYKDLTDSGVKVRRVEG